MESKDGNVYLDYNATTPIDPEVCEVISRSCLEDWGNPSSSYSTGKKAADVLARARAQIADMIGAASPEREITFTSGGTEVRVLALRCSYEEICCFRPIIWPCIRPSRHLRTLALAKGSLT